MSTTILPAAEASEKRFRDGRADQDLYEVVDGLRIEVPPMSSHAAKIATRLATKLNNHADLADLGEAIVESLFCLPLAVDKGRNRRPDVAFVTSERWPSGRPQPIDENAWSVVPDIAVEVVSPNDLAEDQLEKIIEYFQAGVRLVWVVFPKHRRVYVYEEPGSVRVLSDRDVLEGGQVLPGFSLAVGLLFDPVSPPLDS